MAVPEMQSETALGLLSRQGIDSQHIKRRDHSIEIAIQNIPIGLPAQTKNKIEQKKTKKHEAVI